jgi:predicted RNase H-like HicB family nuclease
MNSRNEEKCKRYSILIEWSDEDGVYVVTLPEFPGSHTHGATREEALKNAQEVIDLLIEARKQAGDALPAPRIFGPEAQLV